MVISEKHKIGFIHIPKNAGTSITAWLMATGDFTEMGRKHDTIQHVNNDLMQSLKWFAVVRNPYERLLSHYHFHCKYYNTRMQHPRLASKEKYYTRHQQMQKGFEHYCLSPYQIAHRDPMWYDDRYCPQVIWINDSVHLLRFEKLHKDFGWVQDRVGCDSPLPSINGTPEDNVNYRKHYTQKIRDVADQHFKADLDRLGYEW